MKGIILAGGAGTRLYPLTMVTSKQLLPVYDKPMIYYPLSTLMLAGIQDILIISTPTDTPRFEALLGDGSQYGIHLQYKVQPSPDGLAQAFILGEEFIGDDCCAMILGDNIFYGNGFSKLLKSAAANAENKGRCTVFGYYVQDPERFGIVEFDKDGKQVETPDYWLANEEPWGHIDYNRDQKVSFGGKVVENADGTKTWQPAWSVRAVPVDYLVPGYKSGRVNTLRLWSAKSYDEFDLLAFNRSEYMEAVTPQVKAENISKILYPEDSTKVGKELRGMMSWMKK